MWLGYACQGNVRNIERGQVIEMARKRSIKVILWVSKDELAMLDEIACREYECNRSLAIRSLIRKYYESMKR